MMTSLLLWKGTLSLENAKYVADRVKGLLQGRTYIFLPIQDVNNSVVPPSPITGIRLSYTPPDKGGIESISHENKIGFRIVDMHPVTKEFLTSRVDGFDDTYVTPFFEFFHWGFRVTLKFNQTVKMWLFIVP